MSDLGDLRLAIETIDDRILELLTTRMSKVEGIAAAKLGAASPLRDPVREEALLSRLRERAVEHGLDPRSVEAIYRQVLRMSVARQQAYLDELPTVPLRVAYQGVEGSYSHRAAQRRYAGREGGTLLTGFPTVFAAAEAVREGRADCALLPIENTTAGSINETYDALADGGLTINGEQLQAIEHALLGVPGATLEQVRTVLSHPQALAQCSRFLARLPEVETRAEFDTAGSAARVREAATPTLAAIASEEAATTYGLVVLRSAIQNEAVNFTRFVEIAREGAEQRGDGPFKTSLLMAVDHRAGALGDVLQVFQSRGVNLCKLESRPLPGKPGQYRFYLDLVGHADDEPVAGALERIRPRTVELRLLGTYVEATE